MGQMVGRGRGWNSKSVSVCIFVCIFVVPVIRIMVIENLYCAVQSSLFEDLSSSLFHLYVRIFVSVYYASTSSPVP